MKHCDACGFDNEDTAKFCTNCGKALLSGGNPVPPNPSAGLGGQNGETPHYGSNPQSGKQAPGFSITTGQAQPASSKGTRPEMRGPEPAREAPVRQPSVRENRSHRPRPLYLVLMAPFFFLFLIFLIGTFMDWTGFPFLFLFGIPSYLFYKLAMTPKEDEVVTIKTNVPRTYGKASFVLVCVVLTVVLTFLGIMIVPM